MKSYRVYQIDAFTTERFKGNAAGVVPEADGLSDDAMQAIARELNNSETAFILKATGPDHQVWVRFFTPTTEVPSCGHATVAAHYVRAIENSAGPGTFKHKIGIGVLPIEIEKVGDDYKIIVTQGRPEIEDPLPDSDQQETLGALGLGAFDRDDRCPVQIVSTGHSKVMVGIKRRAKLDSLSPDLGRLKKLSARIGCKGYYVFTLEGVVPGVLAHGRMFAPAIGIPEDPVTGNANGPLGAYLVKHRLVTLENGSLQFTARQGEAMGRAGSIEGMVDGADGSPARVRIAGRAVVAFSTEIQV